MVRLSPKQPTQLKYGLGQPLLRDLPKEAGSRGILRTREIYNVVRLYENSGHF